EEFEKKKARKYVESLPNSELLALDEMLWRSTIDEEHGLPLAGFDFLLKPLVAEAIYKRQRTTLLVLSEPPPELNSTSSQLGPPSVVQFLFYLFLDPQNCDALVGDLEERYRLIRKKFGKRKADFWYWTQAIHSVCPVAWRWCKNLVMKPVLTIF